MDGFLYGCTSTTNELFRLARDGFSYAVVHTFPSTEAFPLMPVGLVRGADQRLYGLTDKNGTGGRGALFRLNPDGTGFLVLRDLGAGAAADQAATPKAICAGMDGAIYGVVRQQGNGGAGVFRYRPSDGSFLWLHTFTSSAADSGAILVGSDGMIYVAIDTASVKTEQLCRMDMDGVSFAVLRMLTSSTTSFTGTAALTEGPDGLLYGVTTRNGSSTVPLLFRITRDGSTFTPLHDVTAGTDPATNPPRGLLATSNGLLFGFASNVIFRSNADGTGFQTVHTYSTGTTFALQPIEGFDGKIYGALPFGGTPRRGSVFRMFPDGSNYEEPVTFSNQSLSGQAPLGTVNHWTRRRLPRSQPSRRRRESRHALPSSHTHANRRHRRRQLALR